MLSASIAGLAAAVCFLAPVPVLAYDYLAPTGPEYGIAMVGYRRFLDVRGDEWYATEEMLGYALDNSLMTGTGGGYFDPARALTRGQAVTVLWRVMGEPRASAAAFADVSSGAFYADAVNWARACGIIEGFPGNRFRPEAPITREQLAKLVALCAAEGGVDTSGIDDLSRFEDVSSISDWARPYMAWCAAENIITGKVVSGRTLADPQGLAERSQFSKIASVLHRDVLGLAGPGSARLEVERQEALASNPTVIHSTPSDQNSEIVNLTGVVRRTLSWDSTLGRVVPVFYLELPEAVTLVGTQYLAPPYTKIVIGGGEAESCVGKTATLRTGIYFESSPSYAGTLVSNLWSTVKFYPLRVFELC